MYIDIVAASALVGLVAGDAIMGILMAIFATLKINIAFGKNFMPSITGNPWTAAVIMLMFAVWAYKFIVNKDKFEA